MCKYSSIDSKEALASTIGVSVRQITGLVYGIGIDNCYHSFYISKKNGKKRQISAPNKSLKYVQRRLCRLLIEKLNDFYLEYKIKNQIAHGFLKGKSIKTNALPHRNKRYVLNIDLKDFLILFILVEYRAFFKKIIILNYQK